MLTIGRCGIDVTLDDPETWNMAGSKIDLSGWIQPASVSDAKTLRQQLLGYVASRDEQAVPVTWSEDSTNDGWYYVTDASVSTTPLSLATGWFAFSVTLERVGGSLGGYSQPQLQSTLIGNIRPNSLAITTGTNWHAVPLLAADYWRHSVGGNGYFSSRVSASGSVFYLADTGPIATGFTGSDTTSASFYLLPLDAYRGAARLELASNASPASSDLRVVVGRQIPPPTMWRISNDLLRVTSGATPGTIDVQCYDGTQWEATTVALMPTYDTAPGAAPLLLSVTVLRNSPEVVAIRIRVTPPPDGNLNRWYGRVNLDLTLRRGDRLVQGSLTADSGLSWGIKQNVALASTAVTAGLRATANDASGNRFLLISPNTTTATAATGALRLTTNATRFDFAAGYEVGGSGAAPFDTATALTQQYFYVNAERQSAVSR